jgi:hypothetical protein
MEIGDGSDFPSSQLEALLCLYRVADLGSFAVPDLVFGGEDVDASKVNSAVFFDVPIYTELSKRKKMANPPQGSGSNVVVPGITGEKRMWREGVPAEERPAM